MDYYAFIDTNGVVVEVIPGMTQGDQGIDWEAHYAALRGLDCRLTAIDGSTRKNYAGRGFTYDHVRNAFIAPKPSGDAIFDEESCKWITTDVEPSEGGA